MMNDTQYEWYKEHLDAKIVYGLIMDIRCLIHAKDKDYEQWKSGEIHGYLRGLSDGGVADFYTLLQFKDKMYAEVLYDITKEEEEHERRQE